MPLSEDLLVGPTLLLNPGVVFQVMDPASVCIPSFQHVIRFQPVQVAGEVSRGIIRLVLAEFLVHFLQAALVEFHRIGEDREHDIVFAQFIVFSELNRHCEVGDAGET